MGNTFTKREEESVDGGFVFPTGVVYQKNDCDLRIVRKLILESRVAPFYRGVNDAPEHSSIECPICFLYYPSNMNYSRCCNQPVCTECFSQIQQPKTGGPALCPFCQLPDFGVTYIAPSQNPEGKSKGKFDPLPVESPLVISIDQIRPNGRHHPPPPEPEPVRRRTISGRPSGNRPSSRRTHISSSFNPDPLYGNHSVRIQASSRYTAAARDVEAEIENLMLMEAIQLSLMEMEQQQRKHKHEIRANPSASPASPIPAQSGGESSGSYRPRAISDSSLSSSSSSDGSHPDSLL